MRSPGFYGAGYGVAVPPQVVPPSSSNPAALATWFTGNSALFNRVHLPVATPVRYVCFNIGVQSGNIQVGVVSLAASGSGDTITATRVLNSGVVACPATGNVRYDLGLTTLPAGDYALFFWADNTTVTVGHSLVTGYTGSRLTFTVSNASGVQASSTLSVTTRYLSGFTLESVI